MTNTDIAVREEPRATVALSNEQLQYIAHTEFVPQGLRGNVPAIMACVATGRALGIDDMSALRLIHVVNGRPTFSAELMVQIVRRHGHSITGESKEGSCTVTGTRLDNGDTMTVTWTLAMAQRAGLANKQTWKQYPEALLWARAASQLCRMLFADCFAGATYTPEELDDGVFEAPAEPAQPQPEVKPATTAQKKKLNVLVGQLRDQQGRVQTHELWEFMGKQEEMKDAIDGSMVVHWSPLRDQLTDAEASFLIDTLERFAADPSAEWAAGSSSTTEEPQAEVSTPYVSQDAAVSPADSQREPASSGLTMTELRARMAVAGYGGDRVATVARQLFPDVSGASALTDEQRGELWEAVLASDPLNVGGE